MTSTWPPNIPSNSTMTTKLSSYRPSCTTIYCWSHLLFTNRSTSGSISNILGLSSRCFYHDCLNIALWYALNVISPWKNAKENKNNNYLNSSLNNQPITYILKWLFDQIRIHYLYYVHYSMKNKYHENEGFQVAMVIIFPKSTL
jgi:hypothetical protein